jgi:hypothetical protein
LQWESVKGKVRNEIIHEDTILTLPDISVTAVYQVDYLAVLMLSCTFQRKGM